MKRFTVTLNLYMWAEDDAEVIAMAKKEGRCNHMTLTSGTT